MAGVLWILVALTLLFSAIYGWATWKAARARRKDALVIAATAQAYAEYVAYSDALRALAASPSDRALAARALNAGRIYISRSTASSAPKGMPPAMVKMAALATSEAVVKRDIESAMRGEIPKHLRTGRS